MADTSGIGTGIENFENSGIGIGTGIETSGIGIEDFGIGIEDYGIEGIEKY